MGEPLEFRTKGRCCRKYGGDVMGGRNSLNIRRGWR